jgi:hypothetical protein
MDRRRRSPPAPVRRVRVRGPARPPNSPSSPTELEVPSALPSPTSPAAELDESPDEVRVARPRRSPPRRGKAKRKADETSAKPYEQTINMVLAEHTNNAKPAEQTNAKPDEQTNNTKPAEKAEYDCSPTSLAEPTLPAEKTNNALRADQTEMTQMTGTATSPAENTNNTKPAEKTNNALRADQTEKMTGTATSPAEENNNAVRADQTEMTQMTGTECLFCSATNKPLKQYFHGFLCDFCSRHPPPKHMMRKRMAEIVAAHGPATGAEASDTDVEASVPVVIEEPANKATSLWTHGPSSSSTSLRYAVPSLHLYYVKLPGEDDVDMGSILFSRSHFSEPAGPEHKRHRWTKHFVEQGVQTIKKEVVDRGTSTCNC